MRDGQVHSFNFMSIGSYFGWTGVSLNARLSMLKLLPYMLRSGRSDVYHHVERDNPAYIVIGKTNDIVLFRRQLTHA